MVVVSLYVGFVLMMNPEKHWILPMTACIGDNGSFDSYSLFKVWATCPF